MNRTPTVVGAPEPLDDGCTQVIVKVPGMARTLRVIIPPDLIDEWAEMPVWNVLRVAARAVKDGAK